MAQGVLEPISPQQIYDVSKQRSHNRNQVEHVRAGNIPLPPEGFIIEAHEMLKGKS